MTKIVQVRSGGTCLRIQTSEAREIAGSELILLRISKSKVQLLIVKYNSVLSICPHGKQINEAIRYKL